MSIVVFCGGTGFRHLYRPFAEYDPGLRLIINGFDDGLTSGQIRERLGILGPSDFGKVLGVLMKPSMRTWWEDRRFAMGAVGSTGEVVQAGRDHGLSLAMATQVASLIQPLERLCASTPIKGVPPRNFVMAASLLLYRGDANSAIRQVVDLLELNSPPGVVSLTDGDVRLRAWTSSGHVLEHEFELNRVNEPITRLDAIGEDGPARPSSHVEATLSRATCVVMGPGSSYSSIIASLVLAAPFIARRQIPRIWVHPLASESPGAPKSAADAVASVAALTGLPLISDVLVDAPETDRLLHAGTPAYREHRAPVADAAGKHDPSRLLTAIVSILTQHRTGKDACERRSGAGTCA